MNFVTRSGLSGTPKIVPVQRGHHLDWSRVWGKSLFGSSGQCREEPSEVRESGEEEGQYHTGQSRLGDLNGAHFNCLSTKEPIFRVEQLADTFKQSRRVML